MNPQSQNNCFDINKCCIKCVKTDKKEYKITSKLLKNIYDKTLKLKKQSLLLLEIDKFRIYCFIREK